ncbi:uncharacterized protein [Solanum lycopersicum]|uniref:uncharacterized protein n=1 Tax=Solanum lycopersicum TaxID=4081 RepID=UPI0037495CBF
MTEDLMNWSKPLTPIDIRSFLGLAGYYFRFVKGLSSIVSLLRALTNKKSKFEWTETSEKCFNELNDRLTSASVLTLPKCGGSYTVYCDASRTTKDSKTVFAERELNLRQRRLLEPLKDYDRNVHYHPCKANVVVMWGFLVHPNSESSLAVEVMQGQHLDPVLMELKDSMLIKMNDSFTLEDVDDLRTNIVTKAHGSRYSLHPGSTKMYRDIKKIYWWDDMKKDITEYVAKCSNCQQVKAEHFKPGGLTQIFEGPT